MVIIAPPLRRPVPAVRRPLVVGYTITGAARTRRKGRITHPPVRAQIPYGHLVDGSSAAAYTPAMVLGQRHPRARD